MSTQENDGQHGLGEQGEFRLDLPKQPSQEELTRKELISKSNKVLLLFAEKAIPPLYDKVRKGEGKQVLSSHEEGRPDEELIDIDQTGENILKSAIREVGFPAILISENTPEPTEFGNGAPEKFFVYQDPFDNTSQYKRDLDTSPYTVFSIWDKEGQPIGAVVGDIKDKKAYVNIEGEIFMWDLERKSVEKQLFAESKERSLKDHIRLLQKRVQLVSENPEQTVKLLEIDSQIADLRKPLPNNQERSAESSEAENKLLEQRAELVKIPELQPFIENSKQIAEMEEKAAKAQIAFNEAQKREPERKKINKSDRTTLKGDRNATLATFVGEKKYSSKFIKHFGKLVNEMHPKGLLYTGGGAYIYGLLANGSIDAYVMFDEPASEIIPGLPLALAAGCTVVSVHEDGTYQEFKFDPNAMKANHKLYSEGSVPLFIAAATPEIRDEIIQSYLQSKEDIKLQELKEAYVASKAQEFEIYRSGASQQPQNPATS